MITLIRTQEQFEAWVVSTGCTAKIEDFGEVAPSITLHAPTRKVFKRRGTHLDASISCVGPNGKPNWKHAQSMVEKLLSEGFVTCKNGACETCAVSPDVPTEKKPTPSTHLLKRVFAHLFK